MKTIHLVWMVAVWVACSHWGYAQPPGTLTPKDASTVRQVG
ncbi:MAG: hypothetical protein R2795_20975 [Saprospiraceae bacterium]